MPFFRPSREARAFFAFHLRVGARVGLRLLAPVLIAVFVAYYLLRPEFTLMLGDHLLTRTSILGRGLWLAVLLLAAAAVLSPRVSFGEAGWIRHLPSTAARRRRLAALSTLLAELPLLGVGAALAFATSGKNGPPEALAVTGGLLLGGYAAALAVYPSRRPVWAYAASAAGCVLCAAGAPAPGIVGAGLVLASDAAAGRALLRPRVRRLRSVPRGASAFWAEVNRRALGLGAAGSLLPALAPLGLGLLLLRNNAFPPETARAAARFAGAAAAVLQLAAAAKRLARRRPIWAWSRSLPISSRSKVVVDLLCLAAPSLAVAAAAAGIDPAAAPFVLAFLPYAGLRAAAAVRPSMASDRSPLPGFVLEGLLAAMLLALRPWTIVPLLMLVPAALRAAIRREQSVKPGRWNEKRFAAAGDPQSGSAR